MLPVHYEVVHDGGRPDCLPPLAQPIAVLTGVEPATTFSHEGIHTDINYRTFMDILLRIQISMLRLPSDKRFAVLMGLEPTTPCVTGRYSNQLNYNTKFQYVNELYNKKTRLLRSRVSISLRYIVILYHYQRTRLYVPLPHHPPIIGQRASVIICSSNFSSVSLF